MSTTVSLWLALGIFAATFVCIATELLEKAVIAVVAALLCIALGLTSADAAAGYIDLQTLSLLLGMMVVVGAASMSGIFEVLSVKVLKFTRGTPLLIFLLFMILTLLLSSVLNNVTTILIILPLTIEITRGVGLNPRPFVFGEVFFANIGGLLTLIGDPVNTIIGTAAGLSMTQFIVNMSIPVFLHALFILGFLYSINRKQFKSIRGVFSKMLHNQLVISAIEQRMEAKRFHPRFMLLSGVIMAATISCFLFSGSLGVSAGAIAMIGAGVMLAATHRYVKLEAVFHAVEWGTLVFFAGLFVLIGTVEHTGVLETLARMLAGAASSPYALIAILMAMTALVSAFVDNVPFVTVMIPVIRTLQQSPMFAHSPTVLWWAISLAAVMGGMATPIGSSANVVALGTAAKAGFRIRTKEYASRSVIVSLAGLSISYLYLVTAYGI